MNASPKTEYLYCIKFTNGDAAKVGVSNQPKVRFYHVARIAPFDMEFHRVIAFKDRRLADAWERHIIANANRYKARGEWVKADAKLDDLFNEIEDGEDCLEQFLQKSGRGRPVYPDKNETMDLVRSSRFTAQVGIVTASKIDYDGSPEGYNEAVVLARLSEGFGSEDISVIDGIPLEEVRRIIRDARTSGALSEIFANGPSPATPQPAPAEKDR